MGLPGLTFSVLYSLLLFATASFDSEYLNQIRYEEYDYIIVGGGSAGSVIANRLSEDSDTTVLLLEAGGFPDDVSEVPLFSLQMLGGDMDWGYQTTTQDKACLGFEGQRQLLPRGKVLGGSSTINGMVYVRGSPRDFDEWSKGGATGWAWKDVLHYFKKSEDQRDPTYLQDGGGYHATGGYLTVSSNTHTTPLRDAFLEGGQQMGYKVNDINGESFTGFSSLQSTTRDGLRCSTEKAFLRPAAHRDNLDILVEAHVTRLDIDGQKRVRAVHFERHNASQTIKVKREVILSAGAIASPQILMLSGIGPREHLEEMGIEVVANLPVGENLHDHVTATGLLYLLNSSVSLVHSRDITREAIGAMLKGKGMLTIPASVEVIAFLNTRLQDPSEDWPDIAMYFLSSMFLPVADENMAGYLDKDVVTISVMVTRPKSRGYIKLRSRDPHDHPIINPQYLKEEDDLHRLVEGIKLAEELMRTPSMQRFEARRIPLRIPGCENIDSDSEDEHLTCYVRAMTLTTYHQSGTCRMGSTFDPTTVVDPLLRVKGVGGLRVADASVMPHVTSGNTNAPSIMIGEKAADMIRGRFWDPQTEKIVFKDI